MKALETSTAVASISSFTPRGFYQPHRASYPGAAAVPLGSPLQDWYSLPPQLPLSVSSARPTPRPRPRYLQATASAAAAGPKLENLSPSTTGQYSFFFGGIALQTYPFASPALYPWAEPALLSDLWMVDALANTTTLLHGDPAQTGLPAVIGTLTPGVYASTLRPAARHSASLAYDAFTRTIWLFGGAYYPIIANNADKQKFFDDLWSFSLDKRQWAYWRGIAEPVPRPEISQILSNTAPPLATAAAAMAAHEGYIVIYGGTFTCCNKATTKPSCIPMTPIRFRNYNIIILLFDHFRFPRYNRKNISCHILIFFVCGLWLNILFRLLAHSTGYILTSKLNALGYNPVIETPDVYLADNTNGTNITWKRVYDIMTYTDGTHAYPGVANTEPCARAYAALVWETHNAAPVTTLVMYGGTLSALLPSAPLVTASTTLHTAPSPENDSGVLAGLWRLTITLPGTAVWERLDALPLAPTAAERGQPRLVFPSTSSLVSAPGGRVFHAMNIAANGDIFLYGGRGHGAGAYVRPDAAETMEVMLNAQPAAAPFTLPLAGRFDISSVTERGAVSLHAFLYTVDELAAAGLPEKLNLQSLDVMVKLNEESQLGLTGTWQPASRFRVRTCLAATSLNNFSIMSASYLDIAETAMLSQPGLLIDPAKWAPKTYMAINTPYMKDMNLDAASVIATHSSTNVIFFMSIEYVFEGFPTASQSVGFGLEMRDSSDTRSMSIIKDAVSVSGQGYLNFEVYTARPVLLLRSPLPSHPLTQPPVTISRLAAPQLDDLWQFSRATNTWRLLRGFSGPITRSGSAVNRVGSPAIPLAINDSFWPGARLGATLSIPTSSTKQAQVASDTSLFLRGGWTAGSTPAAERAFFADPAVERHLEDCELLAVHDDLWSIDIVTNAANITCIDSTAYDNTVCHPSTANNLTAPFTPWLPQGDVVYGEEARAALSFSNANTCPSGFGANYCNNKGTCVAGGGSAFCHCNSYTQGAQCTSGNIAEVKAKFQLSHGSVLLKGATSPTVLPFAAVAHRPGTGEVYSFGGAVINSSLATAFASAAFTRVDLVANTVTEIPRTAGHAESHEYSQLLVGSFFSGEVYVSPTAPPPSVESHAWFSPDGANMYLYAESFVAPPGLWVYTVALKVCNRLTFFSL